LAVTAQGGGQETGDPAKAAQALIDIVEAEEPPQHLLLGKDAYQWAYGKIDALKKDFEAWKETTLDTDFE
jgi:hypothetical protein